MPLEDVDFMIQNSDRDSVVLFVDSALRDKASYPSPSEYVVDLTQPIHNVYGIEVMDTTIPVTMWNVDKYNDTIAFSQVFLQDGVNQADFVQFFAELQKKLIFNTIFEGKFSSEIFVCQNPVFYEQLKVVAPPQSSPTTNVVFLRRVVYDAPILRTNVVDTVLYHMFVYNKTQYAILKSHVLYAIILGGEFYLDENDLSVVYYEHFFISKTSTNRAFDYEQTSTTVGNVVDKYSQKLFDMLISNTYLKLERGNYTGDDLAIYMERIMVETAAQKVTSKITTDFIKPSVTTTYLEFFYKQSSLLWTFNGRHPFVFDMLKSTVADFFGFSTYAQHSESDRYTKLDHYSNQRLFMSKAMKIEDSTNNADTGGFSYYQQLIPPGIVNLLANRYVLLRIPEIEQHTLKAFGHDKQNPGVGLCKMQAAGSEVTHLRFDFVNLVQKPFHPIGKLLRMTMRFELSGGRLYDFKGVDHHVMIMIKYYTPKNVGRLPSSLLNPNYTPDLLRYMVDHKDVETPNHMQHSIDPKLLLLEQKKYAYSSDSSGEEEPDDDEQYDNDNDGNNNGNDDNDDDEDEDASYSHNHYRYQPYGSQFH